MTAAGAVRPFSARVVRQDWAARAAAPMADALAPGERQRREPVPSSAYGEERRSLFVYRIRNGAGDHVGVIAGVRLDAFADGRVRGHESVEPHRVEALVALYADQPTRSEPVALLHDQPAEATALVGKVTATEPLLTFPGPDGNEHTLWPVDDDVADELAHALGDGVHYIADGHHRVAARLQAWEAAGRPAEGAVLCVLYPLDGLRLSSFHRRVVGPVDADDDVASVDGGAWLGARPRSLGQAAVDPEARLTGGVADGAFSGVDDPVRLIGASVLLELPAEQSGVEVDELLRLRCMDLEVHDETGHGGPPSGRVCNRILVHQHR